jgi:glucan 1,3-beta-glucosidase
MHERTLTRWLAPALLLAGVAVLIAAFWAWLGRPVAVAEGPAVQRLQCVSYAPFRGDQSPLSAGTFIAAAQIEDDLVRLKALTDCIRTYSIEHGLHQVPEIARRVGLKVIQGLWLSSHADKNRVQVETVVELARRFPDVIQSVVVGNEVLLRGELSAADVAGYLRAVKRQVTVPVTYADVWEFWLRHRELLPEVDFVTIHILPYWEDFPIAAGDAAAHVVSIREKVGQAFPGKDILIGETGWPSQGRMREGALPSLVNQATVLQQVLAQSAPRGYRVNIIEAFDQPWKRRLEGTAGGYWGLFDDATRAAKFEWGAPVSNHPHWRWQALGGGAFALLVLAAAVFARGRRGVAPWLAVAVAALAGGAMIGLAVEKAAYESLGLGGWIKSGALLAVAALTPLAVAAALMRGIAMPSFACVLSRAPAAALPRLGLLVGLVAVATAVLAIQTALGLVFDPRYRDFPYAPLTAAVVPLVVMGLAGARPAGGLAERVAGATLLLSAVYILFNESLANWQSLWFCVLIAAFALSLLLRRRAAPDAPG